MHMHRYVAFLRGINVGGHIVLKETLVQLFGSLGFQNIYTFRQSGNIIFETSNKDTNALANEIQIKLKSILGYEVAVFLRTVDQLSKILDAKPFKNQKTAGSSFLVTFVNESVKFPIALPVIIPKSTAEIIKAQEFEVFSVTHGGGEGALPNLFVEKTLKMKATSRNLNILEAIVEKYG